jgi:hypothetical protein
VLQGPHVFPTHSLANLRQPSGVPARAHSVGHRHASIDGGHPVAAHFRAGRLSCRFVQKQLCRPAPATKATTMRYRRNCRTATVRTKPAMQVRPGRRSPPPPHCRCPCRRRGTSGKAVIAQLGVNQSDGPGIRCAGTVSKSQNAPIARLSSPAPSTLKTGRVADLNPECMWGPLLTRGLCSLHCRRCRQGKR